MTERGEGPSPPRHARNKRLYTMPSKEAAEEFAFYRRCARERGIDPDAYIERIGMAQMAWSFWEQGISISRIEQLTGIPAAELRDILRFDKGD